MQQYKILFYSILTNKSICLKEATALIVTRARENSVEDKIFP